MEETAEAPDFLILRLQIFCKLLHGLGINDTVILCVNDEDGAGKGGFRDRRPLDCREHAAEEADRDLAMDERIVVVFGAFFFVVRQVGGLDAVRKMQLFEQGRKAEVENGLQDRGRIEDAHGGRRKHKARELGRVRIAKAEEIINGDQSAQAMREEKERALLTQLAIGLEPGHLETTPRSQHYSQNQVSAHVVTLLVGKFSNNPYMRFRRLNAKTAA